MSSARTSSPRKVGGGTKRLLFHLRLEVRLLSLLLVVVAFFAWGPLPALGVLLFGVVGKGAIRQLVRRRYPQDLDYAGREEGS